jgi:hypothetical protein
MKLCVFQILLETFREKEENYFQFAHEVDLDYNDMYKFASAIFENPDSLHENSKNITRHLFEQSNHPILKRGSVRNLSNQC